MQRNTPRDNSLTRLLDELEPLLKAHPSQHMWFQWALESVLKGASGLLGGLGGLIRPRNAPGGHAMGADEPCQAPL